MIACLKVAESWSYGIVFSCNCKTDSERTILRRCYISHEDYARRTVKDDIRADRSVREEADFVFELVRRLFWPTWRAGIVASVCQRTVIKPAPQNGWGHRAGVQDRASDVTTLSRVDQVGWREAPRSMPADCGQRPCPSRINRLRGWVWHAQERQRHGGRRSPVEWQPREDRQLCGGRSSQLLCARLSSVVG